MEKKIVLDSVKEMPDNFELDELIERLIILEKIERGRVEIKEGKTNSHLEAKEKLGKWLK